jgi:hypothetical protein
MSDNQLVINTFIAGGLAGATSRTVVSPLERLKIILWVLQSREVLETDGIDKYKLARKVEYQVKHMGEYGRAWVVCGSRRGFRGS